MRRALILLFLILSCSLLLPSNYLYCDEEETTVSADAEDIVAPPEEEEGKATQVRVDFAVLDVSNIFDKEQKITVDFAIQLTWKDPRLAKEVGEEEMEANVEDVWTPDVQILNDISLQKKMDDVVLIKPDQTVIMQQRYIGDISQRLNLKNFPWDKHRFQIKLGASNETVESLEFVEGDVYFPENAKVTIEDWWFREGSLNTEPISFEWFKPTVPGFTYYFYGDRLTNFYIWTLIIPLCVIICMSWSVFWLDPQPELFGPQAGIASTAMLTVVAFRFVLVNFIPNVSYMTRMDKFLLGALILVFLALIEVIATSDLAKRGKLEKARKIDFISRFAFPTVFALMILFSFVF